MMMCQWFVRSRSQGNRFQQTAFSPHLSACQAGFISSSSYSTALIFLSRVSPWLLRTLSPRRRYDCAPQMAFVYPTAFPAGGRLKTTSHPINCFFFPYSKFPLFFPPLMSGDTNKTGKLIEDVLGSNRTEKHFVLEVGVDPALHQKEDGIPSKCFTREMLRLAACEIP